MQQPEGSLLSVLLRYKIKIFKIKKKVSYLKASFVLYIDAILDVTKGIAITEGLFAKM